ncbi:adenylate-forming reductase 03009-like [Syzygium oleosum]|uniref:adenylate-forming reductase 03009-like n=1 Tax=Syzygium oleosum TaxID=219896 RepID=UPI0024B9AF1B|nr:adenylate-forming reductase 03009-like [Syzygium oleosum]
MESPVRFLSCRGVAFEIKPHADPFAITTPQRAPEMTNYGSKRSWLPWPRGSSSRVAPSSLIQRSTSKVSSHFCDLDLDDDDDDEPNEVVLEMLEEGTFIEPEKHSERKQAEVASKIDPPPSKPARGQELSRLSVILLDQGLFTVYKRLFVVSLTLNVVALVLAATGHFPYARNRAALFSIANIFALTLCRSEAFLRIAFWLAVELLGHSWIPLFAKTATTSLLQSLGGIHSGCGVSSLAWLVYALVLTLKDRDSTSPEIVGVALVILVLIALSCLLWGFVVLTVAYDPRTKSYKSDELGLRLVRQQESWFTVGITVLIIIPWVTVRRVLVKVSSPSGHASIIKFHGGVKAGILGRISPSPLSEWHAFGIISDGKDEHMMLAGAVGDFTKSLVANPPTHLWVRQVHFAGLPYLVNMYDRVLLVATGSGICVFLSFLLQPCKASVCVLWVAKNMEQNFGKEIKEMVSCHPRDKVIVHDTAVHGRPNVAEMSVDMAKKWGAEVVIVTSNPEGSRDVVNACKNKGIAAFGPIWDS